MSVMVRVGSGSARGGKDKWADAFLDYLADRYTIDEVAGGTQVKLADGPCPLCGETRMDLRVYVSTRTTKGYCHHCGEGFNAVSFVMAYDRCGKERARDILRGASSGIKREIEEEELKPIPIVWPPLYRAEDFPFAQDYLTDRHVTAELIERHQIRFAVDNIEVPQPDGSMKLYRTKNRIIVPIFNESGDPVGWQGRDITGKSKIKYLFAPGFDAGEHLYNYDRFDPDLGYAILTEGVFHVYGWERFGVKNALGTFGKKLSEPHQLDLLLRHREKLRVLFLAWDSDAAWQKAEFCEKYGHYFAIRLVDLRGKDSDEFERFDPLKEALTSARAYSWADKVLSRL
jgi:DNA primase